MQLKPMTESEFRSYLEQVYVGYAEEQIKAGSWMAEGALKRAKAEINDLLPDGLATRNNFLYNLIVANEPSPVGVVWILIHERNDRKEAFIADIAVFNAFRRKGYAGQALNALEEIVKEMGIHTIRLHVFGHNHAARDLYEKSGYEMINIYMEKQI
jgi:ribosomal protein S18 acetylase RimI-like enzyme